MLALSSCSDQFLDDKKNYDNVSNDIYNYYSGADGRVQDVYAWCLPDDGSISWKIPSTGLPDICSKATEEYAGFGSFNDPLTELSSTSSTNGVPDFFMNANANIQEAVYGRIRNINDVIRGINGGSLSEAEKNELLGQVYFFRGWCYYNLMKWYGGVPLVKEVLDPLEGSFTPRSSAKETYEFIINDLQTAADMLMARTGNGGWEGSNWGRVTAGTALALKGRVMLLWASPLFNRANDESRWEAAYEAMKTDLPLIEACGYGLYTDTSNPNGKDFASMFLQAGANPEAVFVTLYNNKEGDGLDTQKNNSWERNIRPSNTGGQGQAASANIVDLFPMKDGKMPALQIDLMQTYNYKNTYKKLEKSEIPYDADAPFLNRDPRFYWTFAMPGFRWAYSGDASMKDPNNPADGKNYTLWNYVWYTESDSQGNPASGDSFGADNLMNSKRGVYVRKKSDDFDVNSAAMYTYAATATYDCAPYYSGAPLIELRFAEVLLNYAEAACMAGYMETAVELMKKIRARVGYTGDCGFQANLASDQQACMSAVLYERMIELAYEGKRFDDLRRWMLFDGGVEMANGAPETWKLTGWDGNTCTWLGFTPMNEQRRENMQFRTGDDFGPGGTSFDQDPILLDGTKRPAGVKFTNDTTQVNADLAVLARWYNSNLVREMKYGDGRDSQNNLLNPKFLPKYYFLGFNHSATSNNKGIQQTIGWEDYNNGNENGTFDPLAE